MAIYLGPKLQNFFDIPKYSEILMHDLLVWQLAKFEVINSLSSSIAVLA